MKAMRLNRAQPVDTNPLEFAELPAPAPGPNEIRIQVRACGVCRTDLHIVEGELELPKLPVIPGHQVVGVVERVGENVTRFREGDRVGVPWLYSTCGQCAFCRRGKENLCEVGRFTGYHVDGGYAQYVIVSENFAYHLPEGLSDAETAPLLCAGVIGYRALRLSELQPGERLGLYGFGGSAHIVIQIARHWDCEVYVFTRNEEHQRLARELGAAWAGGVEDEPPAKINSGIVFAPAGWIVLEALRMLEKGGTLSLAGIYMSPIPELDYNLLYHERTIRSAANSTREDVRELLRLAGEIPIRTEVEVFPLEAANEALQRLKRSEISGAGVLEVPQD
ncbi:MAG: zinc-dependent alcohol dehydrogenase family protein [Acidobacteria bacterium]|nr:zinc-dependent alcohol dehydrogenase family protein [Acidobacteriota bacterium]